MELFSVPDSVVKDRYGPQQLNGWASDADFDSTCNAILTLVPGLSIMVSLLIDIPTVSLFLTSALFCPFIATISSPNRPFLDPNCPL